MHFISTQHVYEHFRHNQPPPPASTHSEVRDRSTVACSNEFDRIWNVDTKLRLTYCMGAFTSEPLKEMVQNAFPEAVAQMERAADVNYIEIHFPSPEDCEAAWGDGDVLYVVRQARECTDEPTTGPEPEEACDCGRPNQFPCTFGGFGSFPDSVGTAAVPTEARRRIVFREKIMQTDNNAGPARTVVHELGHSLGLYHEQARWEQTSLTDSNEALCSVKPADAPWRAVMPPDPNSIMGYPDCDDLNDIPEPQLSASDRQGLHYLYSIPRTGELHFDPGPTDDILWVNPLSTNMVVWYGGADGDNILFEDVPFTAPLPPASQISRRVKPIPVRIDSEPLSHILLYAPGNDADDPDGGVPQSDLVFAPDPGATPPFANTDYGKEQSERYAFPIVGRFLGTATDEVWWLLPGADGGRSDGMWKFIPTSESTVDDSSYDGSFSADNYRRPLVGSWLSGSTPDGQIVWWREPGGSQRFRLMTQNINMDGFAGDTADFIPCGLSDGSEYTPLIGNFDIDSEWEIFWVSARGSTHVMWWNVEQIAKNGVCNAGTTSSFLFTTPTFFKPFVGRFNNDSTNDIFWYRGGHILSPEELEDAEPEQVWYFADDTSHDVEILPLSDAVEGDFSPYVGDFDGDGCEDILWFAPHTGHSPLSRARCTTPPALSEGFDAQDNQAHPQGFYPVGYTRTRARR